eukprot:TRINITY_DN49863_c0_g1_i1.p1 TRINITY_DN49863_c0_g1~~TRINITY_DN49863_c0_g1_i1.p1  ORF type:complete len:110 (+),score=29.85 TRINITY_DN49863_c0_g1_i1:1-330(+)
MLRAGSGEVCSLVMIDYGYFIVDCVIIGYRYLSFINIFFFFSSRRRHTRCREVSWARRCVQETESLLVIIQFHKVVSSEKIRHFVEPALLLFLFYHSFSDLLEFFMIFY